MILRRRARSAAGAQHPTLPPAVPLAGSGSARVMHLRLKLTF